MLSVTPSLYSSYYYYAVKHIGNTEEDFLKVLSKQPTETTPAMQAGIDFENKVQSICEGKESLQDNIWGRVAKIVNGGLWQEKVGREFGDYWLYGRADVIKGDTIYDIKTTNSYDLNKYEYSIQHLIYCYATGIEKFRYLIVDTHRVNPEDWSLYIEDYNFDKWELEKLKSRIFQLVSYLGSFEKFDQIYRENWDINP